MPDKVTLRVPSGRKGTFNDYVDKKRWYLGLRCSKKSLFLSTFRVRNVHVEVGCGQKVAK